MVGVWNQNLRDPAATVPHHDLNTLELLRWHWVEG